MRRIPAVLPGLLIWLFFTGFTGPASVYSQGISPDITVALDGTGDFTKIQDAIDAVPDNSSLSTTIFIKRGLYDTEKLMIPATKTNLIIIGESRDETILSYHLYDCPTGGFQGKCPAADAQLWSSENIKTSATLTILADDVRIENLTLQNTAGPVGQAQAVTVRSDRVIFRNVDLLGYQDTIYFWSLAKRSYFENCLVVGRTDYIYGGGTAFFESCEIRSWGGGWITAPSTDQNQPHGFVFNQCDLTYALNSPRAGDDGSLVRLGRPWQNYPKVAWLFCEMTDKIHPEGWGDKWNMPYSDTSTDLHLYEYMNTGPGADTSGRADWAGIRVLADSEAVNYTVMAVLGGTDNWDPTASGAVIPTYSWTGGDTAAFWRLENNWNPVGVPDTFEAAYVDGVDTIIANGGHFVADLNILSGATLQISAPSIVTYLAIDSASILVDNNALSLDGRIRTKGEVSLDVTTGNVFDLHTEVVGVHDIQKDGEGELFLTQDNTNFTGYWTSSAGTLVASTTNSLGKARGVTVDSAATLRIEVAEGIDTNTFLDIRNGGSLVLSEDISLLEFYLDGVLQPVGTYSAATNPTIISGPGLLTVGRPTSYIFIGGGNGNWDNATHFQPALVPEAGDTVYTNIEMETTGFVFPADIYVQAGGRMRLRGTHTATGTIYMENSTSFNYATSGAGFTLNAPTVIQGDISFVMNSRAVPSHAMRLGGPISGDRNVSIINQRADTENTGIVVLSGDNSGFTGTWDLTIPSVNVNAVAAIEATGANSLGNGTVDIAANNVLILAQAKAAGDSLRVNLADLGSIQLDSAVYVQYAVIDGQILSSGTYTASTDPSIFSGSGSLNVGINVALESPKDPVNIYLAGNQLIVEGARTNVSIYELAGRLLLSNNSQQTISLEGLPSGLYLVRYVVDGQEGATKIWVK